MMSIEKLRNCKFSAAFSLAFIEQKELIWYDGLATYCAMSM